MDPIAPAAHVPLPANEPGAAAAHAAPPTPDPANPFTIGEFNVENFFPPGDNAAAHVPVTPEQYSAKLAKLALAVHGQMNNPDVLALEEVGSQQSLDDLLSKTDLGAAGYKGILLPTNDKRGINVALLYNAGRVSLDGDPTALTPNGGDGMSGSGGEVDPTKLFARPPLVVNLRVNPAGTSGSADAADGAQQLQLVVNHLLAKPGGAKNDARRGAQATFLGNYVDQQTAKNPQRGVVVLGDFNANYGEQAYTNLTTRPDGTQRMFDTPALALPVDQRYTYIYRGQHDMLDHTLVSENLRNAVVGVNIPHFDSSDNHQHAGDPSVPNGVSDHDPMITTFDFSRFGAPAAAATAQAALAQSH